VSTGISVVSIQAGSRSALSTSSAPPAATTGLGAQPHVIAAERQITKSAAA
jgi:hypothetical protein